MPILTLCLPPLNGMPPEYALHPQGELRREFYDPNLGSHWQLFVDPQHPSQPGRLILVGQRRSAAAAIEAASLDHRSPLPPGVPISGLPEPVLPWVIRAGERVTVDQETSALHARLQAVALESAGTGQTVRVRLSAGADAEHGMYGKVILAVATGVRQARWLGAEGSKP